MKVNNSRSKVEIFLLRHLYPFLILGITLIAASPLSAQVSKEVFLKTEISVEGPYISLGDLFMNVDEALADTSVAKAPEPGKRLVFTPRHIASFARVHQLTWRNAGRQARIVVRRESRIIDADDIAPVLAQAIADQGGHPTMEIVFNEPTIQFHVALNSDAELEIRDLSFNPANGLFEASLAMDDDESSARSRRIAGRVFATRRVPVLVGYAERGMLLKDAGIEWKEVRISRLSQTIVTDMTDLDGMVAKRHLIPGQMIRSSDIQKPLVIKKGATLTINYQAPGLTLSVQGRAVENGSRGDIIRVVNTRSNQTIEARVIGPSTVAAPRSMELSAH